MKLFRKKRPTEAAEKTVFFLHIPKCAGTTLIEEIIKKQFRPRQLILFYGKDTPELIDRLKNLPEKKQKKIRCIAGHFGFGVHRFYTARPATYITLLRDPVERIISHYFYVLRKNDHYLHRIVKEKRYTLREYVENHLTVELNNGQTQQLAGIGWNAKYGQCLPAMLDQARENLEKHFAVVGVSERFDEFVRLASVELGWDVPRYQRKNVSESRLMLNSIDRETLGVIEHFNRLDIELYKSAAARFEKLFIKIAEDHEDFP